MSAQTAEAFRKAVMMMRLLKSSTVVVGLSGSSDSVALAYLAKQTFARVLAMTVDLNLGGEASRRVEEAAEIARTLGLEHRVVPLDWAEGGRRMTEAVARHRRYPALMEECRKVGARVLMVGHSQDDQIETVVYRISKSSGIEGLGGMQPLSYWATFPDVGIARPFLDCSRESLEQLCREADLPWLEKEVGQSERELLKSVPRKHGELKEGLLELMNVCRETRDRLQPQVAHTVKKLPALDIQHGTLSFPTSTYRSLNPAVARRALGLWIRYIGGVSDVRYDLLSPFHRLLLSAEKTTKMSGSTILVAVDPEKKRAIVARRSPDKWYRTKVPVRVGETILWDNRFSISLLARRDEGSRSESGDAPVFHVRHLVKEDWPLMSKGDIRYKVPVMARGGLPVVVDDQNKIVLMPHFRVASREANVVAAVRFRPVRILDDLLQYSHYHEC